MIRITIALLLASLSSYSIAAPTKVQTQEKIYKLQLSIFSDSSYSVTPEEHGFIKELFTDFNPETVKDRNLLIDVLHFSDILIDHYQQKYNLDNDEFVEKVDVDDVVNTFRLAQEIIQKKYDYINAHEDGYSLCFDSFENIEKARKATKAVYDRKKKEQTRTGILIPFTLSEQNEIDGICEFILDAPYHLESLGVETNISNKRYIDRFLRYMDEDGVIFRHYLGTQSDLLKQEYNRFFNKIKDENITLSKEQVVDLYSYITVKHFWAFNLSDLIPVPLIEHSFPDFGPVLHFSTVYFQILDDYGLDKLRDSFARKMFSSPKSVRHLKRIYGTREPYKGAVEKIINVVGDVPSEIRRQDLSQGSVEYIKGKPVMLEMK